MDTQSARKPTTFIALQRKHRSRMAINNRFSRKKQDEVVMLLKGKKDEKLQKERIQNDRLLRKVGFACLVMTTILLFYEKNRNNHAMSFLGEGEIERAGLKGRNGKKEEYELYPFLVDAKAATKAADNTILSTVTLPEFPIISRLEGCKVMYKPTNPPRESDLWRKKFWIPSYPGSGASNPTNKGDLLRILIEGLFSGEEGNVGGKYFNPVKDFHKSMRNKLKRCKGQSETVGCTSGHPLTSTNPEGQTSDFRPEAILPIRNPATAIPASMAYKNIAYHQATKQAEEDAWRRMRDDYFEDTVNSWMDVIKFWRGSSEDSSYYFTSIYIPFEDLMTTDPSKGTATVQALSDSISGRKAANANDGDFFETSSSKEDHECLWYRSMKEEWRRQQSIIGDYIPAYTQAQKDKMVKELNAFAEEVEKDTFRAEQDASLVSLLRRYAKQIDLYMRVEEAHAPKR